MRVHATPRLGTTNGMLCAVLIVLAVGVPGYGQRVIYVAENAGGATDGSSWSDAYRDLQDALNDARVAGDVDAEIWIAAGTYKADRGTGDAPSAFELFGSIALYGGFAGWEECVEQRDPNVNVTILSADLNGDDDPLAQSASDCCLLGLPPVTCSDESCRALVVAEAPGCATRWTQSCNGVAMGVCCELCRPTFCDNANNVVRVWEPGSNPLLDGLTLTAAETNRPGSPYYGLQGALDAFQANPTVKGCTFTGNRGGTSGISAYQGVLVLDKTLFTGNTGVSVEVASTRAPFVVRGCAFIDNVGTALWARGSDGTIMDSTFLTNDEGIACSSSNCTVVDSRIVDNRAWGIYSDGYVRLFGSLFLRNGVNGLFTTGPALIVNSVFAGNTGDSAPAVSAGFGGIYALNSVFYGNSTRVTGGAMGVGEGGATIRNCIFWGNSAPSGYSQTAQFYSIAKGLSQKQS